MGFGCSSDFWKNSKQGVLFPFSFFAPVEKGVEQSTCHGLFLLSVANLSQGGKNLQSQALIVELKLVQVSTPRSALLLR